MRDIRLTNSCTYEQRLGRLNQIGHRKTQTAESVKGLTKITPVRLLPCDEMDGKTHQT